MLISAMLDVFIIKCAVRQLLRELTKTLHFSGKSRVLTGLPLSKWHRLEK